MKDHELKNVLKTYHQEVMAPKALKEAVLIQIQKRSITEPPLFSAIALRQISIWSVALCFVWGVTFLFPELQQKGIVIISFIDTSMLAFFHMVSSIVFVLFALDRFFYTQSKMF